MSKVRTFSRYFPKGHPKEGQPTFFVEKFWKGLQTIGYSEPLYFFDANGNQYKVKGKSN